VADSAAPRRWPWPFSALEDLAPTLATLLDVEVPSAADGRVLLEMLAEAQASHLGAGSGRP
jgi:hypothetical protein